MTALIALPLALLVGVILGFGPRQVLLAALAWYLALAWQTAYLARNGVTSFDGGTGLHTVHWWVYWALQPVLLAIAVGLTWLGGKAHSTVRSRRRATESSSTGQQTAPPAR